MEKSVVMLEDDRDDRYLTSEVLSELKIGVPVQFFSTSTDLMDYLLHHPKPSLILLDYNSTPENARQVLQKLKTDAGFKSIPVVVLSDNDHDVYKHECYALGASTFIKKPGNIKGTQEKIATFFKYWFEVAEV